MCIFHSRDKAQFGPIAFQKKREEKGLLPHSFPEQRYLAGKMGIILTIMTYIYELYRTCFV